MLIFRAVDKTPKAVPLALVARFEEIDLTQVEYSNGQYVVQYRGQLMPLVMMDVGQKLEAEGRQPVLVFADGHRTMGLVVQEIVDIIEERMRSEEHTSELQSLMRISYAVFCLKKKKQQLENILHLRKYIN